MTVPANNEAALVREALKAGYHGDLDGQWREEALAALNRLAATAERADALQHENESLRQWCTELEKTANADHAALLVAQQERDAVGENADSTLALYEGAKDRAARAEQERDALRDELRVAQEMADQYKTWGDKYLATLDAATDTS